VHPPLSTAKNRFGIPGSQSSIEGINGSLKDEFDFTKQNTVDLLDNFRVNFRNRSMREYEDWGFSFTPLPYGNGGRCKSDKFTPLWIDGLEYLGELNNGRHDQRTLFLHTETYDDNGNLDIEDVSLRIYMCRDTKVLDALQEEAERRKNGSDDSEKSIDDYKADVMLFYFEKHKELISFSEDMYLRYVIKCAKERIVQDTSSTFTSLDEVPENVATIHPELWSHAFYESAKKADYDLNRISVIRRVSTGVDAIGLMRHEPFRVKQDPDKRIIYNWQCTCEHGLRLGFCSHIFFANIAKTSARRGSHCRFM